METYWRKLLEVCAVDKLAVRCRMVIPENCARLPAHMSLTAKLLASPRALTRIQLYCKNRAGYIVPGTLGGEEVSAPTRICLFGPHMKQSSCRSECSMPGDIQGKDVALHSCCCARQGRAMHSCYYTMRGSDTALNGAQCLNCWLGLSKACMWLW